MPKLPPRLKEYFQARINDPLPFEFKPLNRTSFQDLFNPAVESKQYVWLRAQGRLPDDPSFHYLAAAYASDHYLLTTSFLPHGISYLSEPLRVTMLASLDHMLWFHRYFLIHKVTRSSPFRADEWLLFEMESSNSGSGRGLTFGRMYNQQGKLVLSCAQEGVVRASQAPKVRNPKAQL